MTVENVLTGDYKSCDNKRKMKTYSWWFKQAVIAILSIFFLILGVETLVASFGLANPLTFIMAFFSSNLIILISLVGILYLVLQVCTLLKQKQ